MSFRVSKEPAVSHIVIHDDPQNVTQYRQFDDLSNAVAYLEDTKNTEGIENAHLFALEEVKFEVKQYFKVEVVEDVDATDSVDDVDAVEPSSSLWPPTESPPAPSAPAPEILPTAEDAAFADALPDSPAEGSGADSMTLSEGTASESDGPREAMLPGGEPRRGLFGR